MVGHYPIADIRLQFRDGYRVVLIVGVVLYDWEHLEVEPDGRGVQIQDFHLPPYHIVIYVPLAGVIRIATSLEEGVVDGMRGFRLRGDDSRPRCVGDGTVCPARKACYPHGVVVGIAREEVVTALLDGGIQNGG